jgi:hypothetical protein
MAKIKRVHAIQDRLGIRLDKREQYKDLVWSYYVNVKEPLGCLCTTTINNTSVDIYSYNSVQECREAVHKHNRELKLTKLLTG